MKGVSLIAYVFFLLFFFIALYEKSAVYNAEFYIPYLISQMWLMVALILTKMEAK